MSLINQMLKDLEKRSLPELKPENAFAGLQSIPSQRKNKSHREKIIVSIAVSICFLILLNTFFPLRLHHRNALHSHTVNWNRDKSVSSVEIEHSAPSVLTGLTFQIQNGITSIRFLLSQNTLYRVDYDKTTESLVIFLDHAHFIAALPTINYANSSVNQLKMLNLPNGDLKIIIGLNKGVEPKKIDFNDSEKSSELQVDLMVNPLKESVSVNTISTDPKQYGPIKKLVMNMSVEGDYQKALNLVKAGEIENAISTLRDIVSRFPGYSPARQLLAQLLVQTGHINEADSTLKKGLQIQPDCIPLLQMEARLLADKGKPRAALDLLQSVPSPTLAENPEYHALIAGLYQRVGESLMSAKIYEQLIRQDSRQALWWVGFGIALESLDKKTEALQAYTKANEADGLNPELSAFVAGRINQYT